MIFNDKYNKQYCKKNNDHNLRNDNNFSATDISVKFPDTMFSSNQAK